MTRTALPTHAAAYLETREDVDRFVEQVRGARSLAIDTEGASFHKFVDRIYLLQLSSREATAVIDPLPIGTPDSLGRILEDPAVEIVFHDADYDLRLLHQDYGWRVRNIFDTRIAAQLLGIKSFGLSSLLEREFGVKLEKKYQRADWSMRPLTPGMLEYAAQDTMFLLPLRDRLADALERAGRWSWAQEEFERLEGTRWEEEDPGQAFLRVKGARDLTRRELAILRELLPWRDSVAEQLDRATFRVVGNEALLEIARVKPKTKQELAAIRGVPRGMVESRGADILAAVRLGEAVPEDRLPRFPRAPRWERDPEFDQRVAALRLVRDRAAQRLELDPGVLCPRDRLEIIARRRPTTRDELRAIPELRKWQIEEMGREFIEAVRAASE